MAARRPLPHVSPLRGPRVQCKSLSRVILVLNGFGRNNMPPDHVLAQLLAPVRRAPPVILTTSSRVCLKPRRRSGQGWDNLVTVVAVDFDYVHQEGVAKWHEAFTPPISSHHQLVQCVLRPLSLHRVETFLQQLRWTDACPPSVAHFSLLLQECPVQSHGSAGAHRDDARTAGVVPERCASAWLRCPFRHQSHDVCSCKTST